MSAQSGAAAKNVRDPITLNIFLAVDDSLQGISALHTYTSVLHRVAEKVVVAADKTVNLQITHEWTRPCRASELVTHMNDCFEFMHCRSSLLAMIAVFEIALQRLRKRLWSTGHLDTQGAAYKESDYKPLLRWAFHLVTNTQSGSAGMRKRLPIVCGDVDNSRRLRNLILHNNNRYSQSYVDDCIVDGWITAQFQHGHVASISCKEKIFLTDNDFLRFSCSHIELLHILHNTIQAKYFNCKEDYNYAKEGKSTEWYRMVSGKHDVEV